MERIKCKAGMSLMELMVVVSIVSILVAASIFGISSIYGRNQLRAVANDLYQSLVYAKAETQKTQSDVYVSIQSGDSWCYGGKVVSGCDCSIAANCPLFQMDSTDYPNISVSSTGLVSGNLIFEGVRRNVSAAATISILSSTEGQVDISVSSSGGISICSDSLSEFASC